MGGQGFGLLGMSVWRRLLWACLLLSVVWLGYLASVAEDAATDQAAQAGAAGEARP